MPTYGYRCNECATDFDLWQPMSAEAGAACPECGAASTRRFFPAGIVFKGSGFYKTDSRESGERSRSGTPSPAAPAAGAAKDGADGKAGATDAPSPPSKPVPAPAGDSATSSSGAGSSSAEPSAPTSSG